MISLLFPILYQIINVNQTTPCFLNMTAGVQLWRNCGLGDDYIKTMLLGWEWITGGFFSMIIVSIFILITYVKYHKVVYPILIGVMFLPISYFAFPDVFLSWAVVMSGIAFGILIWYAFVRQTQEY